MTKQRRGGDEEEAKGREEETKRRQRRDEEEKTGRRGIGGGEEGQSLDNQNHHAPAQDLTPVSCRFFLHIRLCTRLYSNPSGLTEGMMVNVNARNSLATSPAGSCRASNSSAWRKYSAVEGPTHYRATSLALSIVFGWG